MIRFSFRQSMLAGFVLITLLLGGAVLQSWLVVERFVEESRRGSALALQLNASIQELGERTVDLERSARQYLVLEDAAVLQRFDDHLARTLAAVDRLEAIAGAPLASLVASWREAAGEVREGLHQGSPRGQLAVQIARLSELNDRIGQAGQAWSDSQNARVLAQLEEGRLHLTVQVAAAAAGAVLVALAMGWWLARPIRRLEQAIDRLGEGRFDTPVEVHGPADLRRVGRRLDWLRQRLAELEADRERSLRHVSHELKTPLTALREGIALLREQVVGRLAPSQREVADILQHNVMTLQGQIEGLLDLNGAITGGRRLQRDPVVLRELLLHAVGRRELQVHTRRLTVQVEAPATATWMDEEKMLVVVDNLLSNAIDFSPEAGEICLRGAIGADAVSIDCIDQGPGVAAEDAERIFEPFARGRREAPQPRQGSGVGLSIVRELMVAMGGRVELVPAKAGAHFRVEVPLEA